MQRGSAAPPVDTWERDWRDEVMRQLREIDEGRQQTAVILERLSNRLDEHDRRITTLEQQPERRRDAVTSIGGLWVQIAYVALALGAILMSAASHITLH